MRKLILPAILIVLCFVFFYSCQQDKKIKNLDNSNQNQIYDSEQSSSSDSSIPPPSDSASSDANPSPNSNPSPSAFSGNEFDVAKIKIGDKIAGMTIKSIGVLTANAPLSASNAKVEFEGEAEITGSFSSSLGIGPKIQIKDLDPSSEAKLPKIKGDSRTVWFGFDNESSAEINYSPLGISGKTTIIINNYTLNSEGESANMAAFIKLISKQDNPFFTSCGKPDLFAKESWHNDFKADLGRVSPVIKIEQIPNSCYSKSGSMFIFLVPQSDCAASDIWKYDTENKRLQKSIQNNHESPCLAPAKQFGKRNGVIIPLAASGKDSANCSLNMNFEYNIDKNTTELKKESKKCPNDQQAAIKTY